MGPGLRALLVGGGEIDEKALARELATPALRIAADGGGQAFVHHGAALDWLVGDLDSLSATDLAALQAGGTHTRVYSHDKDQTDLELALELAVELGASFATILGATGSRLDHTLANLGMLSRAASLGVSATIRAPGQRIGLLPPGRTTLAGRPGQVLSLVPLTSEVSGVFTEGLRYPLRGETLYLGRSRGVHNEFLLPEAAVSLTAGELLAFVLDGLA